MPSRTTDSGGFMDRCAPGTSGRPAAYLGGAEAGLGAVAPRHLSLDPARNLASQCLQRYGSVCEHLVVEGADGEPLTHSSGHLVPRTLHPALGDLVQQSIVRLISVQVVLRLP